MKSLLIVMLSLTISISCDKKEEKEPILNTIAKSIFANTASKVLGSMLECSNIPAINNELRSILGLNNKAMFDINALFPCNELVTEILPQAIKDGIIPAQWGCKASQIDFHLSNLAAKICPK